MAPFPGPPRSPAQTEISQFNANRPELASRILSLQSADWIVGTVLNRWLAWRPVVITDRAGRRRLVWLQDVERRWTEGITSGLGPRWVYRKMRDRREWD
jgi:hypothetical protein